MAVGWMAVAAAQRHRQDRRGKEENVSRERKHSESRRLMHDATARQPKCYLNSLSAYAPLSAAPWPLLPRSPVEQQQAQAVLSSWSEKSFWGTVTKLRGVTLHQQMRSGRQQAQGGSEAQNSKEEHAFELEQVVPMCVRQSAPSSSLLACLLSLLLFDCCAHSNSKRAPPCPLRLPPFT